MCLSKAWFKEQTTGEAIMENIVKIRVENDKVILSSLFGQDRIEKATIEEVDFTLNRVILKSE